MSMISMLLEKLVMMTTIFIDFTCFIFIIRVMMRVIAYCFYLILTAY